MHAVDGGIIRFRTQGQDLVAMFLHGTGHVFQRFGALEANLRKFTGRHALDQELCLDECKRTHLICDINKEISLR